LETIKGDIFFDTPFSNLSLSPVHVRVFDSFGYEIGRSNSITVTEEIKKLCEEKNEEKPDEIIPKLTIPNTGKFAEKIQVKISLDKNTKILPNDSWVGVFHLNSENKYDPKKFLSFEYVGRLNSLEWTLTNPGKSLAFDLILPLAYNEIVVAYFSNNICVSYSNKLKVDKIFDVEIFEKTPEAFKILWFQKYGPDSFYKGWIGLFKPNTPPENLNDYITYEYITSRSGAIKINPSYLKYSFDLKLVVNNIVFYKSDTHIGEEKKEEKTEVNKPTSTDKKEENKSSTSTTSTSSTDKKEEKVEEVKKVVRRFGTGPTKTN